MRVELQSLFLLYFVWYGSRLINPTLTVPPQYATGVQGLDLVLLNVAFFHLNRSLRNPTLRYWLTNAQVVNFAAQLIQLFYGWTSSGLFTTSPYQSLFQQIKPISDAVTGATIAVHSYYIAFALLEWLNVNIFHRSTAVGITPDRKLI